MQWLASGPESAAAVISPVGVDVIAVGEGGWVGGRGLCEAEAAEDQRPGCHPPISVLAPASSNPSNELAEDKVAELVDAVVAVEFALVPRGNRRAVRWTTSLGFFRSST